MTTEDVHTYFRLKPTSYDDQERTRQSIQHKP
jgi:hypothetical protein